MPINRLLQGFAFSSEQVRELVHAYESVLESLDLKDRADPITELIAAKIIECARVGEFDRVKLRDCALAELSPK